MIITNTLLLKIFAARLKQANLGSENDSTKDRFW